MPIEQNPDSGTRSDTGRPAGLRDGYATVTPGERVDDRYRLVTRIGRGGTAEVWRAHDQLLGREVAVKLPGPRATRDPALLNRLRIEARATARLDHPNVVTVHDVGEFTGPDGRPLPYVVLELVAGPTLARALGSGPLPWRTAVRICAQVAAGLAAAHARGIVHRDVKPDNVMLTDRGARLVDFGISASVGEIDATPDGELLGTPAYLAPERLETGSVRAACDVYALGLLLYQALTGELPWRWEGLIQLLTAHRYKVPASLDRMPGLPPEVADLYRRCLAKRPADRPTSAEVARTLAAATAGGAAATVTGSGPGRPHGVSGRVVGVTGAGRVPVPPRYAWIEAAADRPSAIAQTISEAPRCASPATNTPSVAVCQ
jgi:serine/threonine-protein kinase